VEADNQVIQAINPIFAESYNPNTNQRLVAAEIGSLYTGIDYIIAVSLYWLQVDISGNKWFPKIPQS
jgi:hypothetical protein